MKKIFKLFTLVIALLCAILLTGCATEEQFETINNPVTELEPITAELAKKGETVIGLYDKKTDTLYLDILSFTQGEGDYYVVTGSREVLPSMDKKGSNFSGWYTTKEFTSGTKVSSGVANSILYAKYMSFAEAGIVALVCMMIVFGMLAIIAGIISLFKFIGPKKEEQQPAVKQVAPQVQAVRPALKLEDITDEDMMAAALVATIDYHEETKEDVRVVSIKQIG